MFAIFCAYTFLKKVYSFPCRSSEKLIFQMCKLDETRRSNMTFRRSHVVHVTDVLQEHLSKLKRIQKVQNKYQEKILKTFTIAISKNCNQAKIVHFMNILNYSAMIIVRCWCPFPIPIRLLLIQERQQIYQKGAMLLANMGQAVLNSDDLVGFILRKTNTSIRVPVHRVSLTLYVCNVCFLSTV